jgi:hypothetical protein
MFHCKTGLWFSIVPGALLISASAWALDVKAGLWQITLDGMPGVQQACFTRELLDAGYKELAAMKMPAGVKCNSEIREQTPKFTVTHTACTGQFAFEGDTRIDVQGPEAMTMTSTASMTIAGQHKTDIKSGAQYKWLSSDCGDVKPVDLDNMFK